MAQALEYLVGQCWAVPNQAAQESKAASPIPHQKSSSCLQVMVHLDLFVSDGAFSQLAKYLAQQLRFAPIVLSEIIDEFIQ